MLPMNCVGEKINYLFSFRFLLLLCRVLFFYVFFVLLFTFWFSCAKGFLCEAKVAFICVYVIIMSDACFLLVLRSSSSLARFTSSVHWIEYNDYSYSFSFLHQLYFLLQTNFPTFFPSFFCCYCFFWRTKYTRCSFFFFFLVFFFSHRELLARVQTVNHITPKM